MHVLIDVAQTSERDEIEALIRQSYRESTQFHVADETQLKFSSEPGASLFLVARMGGRVVACMSATYLRDAGHAREVMECSWDGAAIGFPGLLLGRAATHKEFRRNGLHQALRFGLFSCIGSMAVDTVLDIVHPSAPQLRSMLRLGYVTVPLTRYWYTDIASLEQPCLAYVRSSELERQKRDFEQGLSSGTTLSKLASGFEDRLALLNTRSGWAGAARLAQSE